MNLPAGFTQIRSGFVEVGDYVYISALAVWSEVQADSIYVGSPVRYQSKVFRDPGKVVPTNIVKSHTDLCDELREFDAVTLRSDGFRITRRVVVHKDDQFIYLRSPVSLGLTTSATSDRICRRTGKAWAWTPTGWESKDWKLGESSPYHEGGFTKTNDPEATWAD